MFHVALFFFFFLVVIKSHEILTSLLGAITGQWNGQGGDRVEVLVINEESLSVLVILKMRGIAYTGAL